MGLSVVAPRFAVPTPSPNSAESVNIKNYGSRASIDFMEAATRVNASSRTQPSAIPAISYKLLGSSSNTGKSPLDLLLSNPIQFVKASMMSPVYKRNQAEAFGASNFMSKGKRGAMKKSPLYAEFPPTNEELNAKQYTALVKKLAPTPKSATRDTNRSDDGSTSPSLTRRKRTEVLATKEMPDKRNTSGDATPSKKSGSPRISRSRSKSPGDKIENSSLQTAGKSVNGSKATPIKSTASPPLSSMKQANEVATTLDKFITPPFESSLKAPLDSDLVVPTKDLPKKRKADNSDEINPPAQKIRTDLNGNSSSKLPEPNGNPPPKQHSPNKSDSLPQSIRAKGLSNRMNDCYRNSVLQMLCSSTMFRHEIKQHNPKKCRLSICVACALKNLFEDHHYEAKYNTRKSTNKSISEVIKMARVLPKNFRGTRQEDATEYLHAVLHTCKDQLNKGRKGDDLKDNPVDKTFGGSFPSVLTCPKCHHRSYNKVDLPSLMLQPAIKPRENKAANIIHLTDLLDEHMKPEKVDATCEKCKFNKKKFTKQIEIEKLPQFLVLNVMRWTNTSLRGGRVGADKVMNKLKYEEKIKLMEGKKVVEYVLSSVVAHAGRALSGGHYISFVRQPDGTWAECSDTMVEQTTWATVARAGGLQATILGYQRVD